MTPELQTSRLRLRRWRVDDREPFAAMNADPKVMKYFRARLTPGESDSFVTRIEEHFSQNGFGVWAVEIPNVTPFAGYIGLWVPRFQAPFTPCVEIAWRLAAEYWNRGYATEGAQAALTFGFEVLGLDEIVSFTVPSNLPSRRVMEKIGMTRNPADDFDHPELPEEHALRRHVLYRASQK
jgi:RimJ/RimL family protein N-acetyltransferase